MADIAKLSNMKETVVYKLRLNKLDETSRLLQKHGIINSNGFLTIEGAQVFLDALWQSNPDVQKDIAKELKKLKKNEKEDKKCD